MGSVQLDDGQTPPYPDSCIFLFFLVLMAALYSGYNSRSLKFRSNCFVSWLNKNCCIRCHEQSHEKKSLKLLRCQKLTEWWLQLFAPKNNLYLSILFKCIMCSKVRRLCNIKLDDIFILFLPFILNCWLLVGNIQIGTSGRITVYTLPNDIAWTAVVD